MPMGTIGTPVRAATKAGPSNSSATTGPVRRVPPGNMTSGSPFSMMRMQVRSDSRSAVPRCTGKAPSMEKNRPSAGYFQIEALPM